MEPITRRPSFTSISTCEPAPRFTSSRMGLGMAMTIEPPTLRSVAIGIFNSCVNYTKVKFKFRKSQSSNTTAGENAADFAGGAIVEHWTASVNPIRQRSDSGRSAAIYHCKQVGDKAQIERPCRDKALESLMQRWTVGYAKAPSQVCKAQILCPYLCAWRHQSGCEQSHVHYSAPQTIQFLAFNECLYLVQACLMAGPQKTQVVQCWGAWCRQHSARDFDNDHRGRECKVSLDEVNQRIIAVSEVIYPHGSVDEHSHCGTYASSSSRRRGTS